MSRKIQLLILGAFLAFKASSHAAFINDPAPEFTLTSLSGETLQLADVKGKVIFVNFWASWCPPCKNEFPKLAELANETPPEDFVLLAINLDKGRKSVDQFLEKIGPRPDSMKILLDPKSEVVSKYVARSMPSSFIIDQSGVIRFVHFGYGKDDPEKWRMEVKQLIAEDQ